MRPVRRMEIKRNAWKKKAVQRATSLREARKEIRRLRETILELKKNLDSVKSGQSEPKTPVPLTLTLNNTSPAASNIKEKIRSQCILLAIYAFQSFRSIPKTLAILLHCKWIPHFTSIINWVLLFGLSILNSVKPIPEKWLAIIDTSFSSGTQKILGILRVPISALGQRGSALIFEDVECIGVEVSDSWDAETVEASLEYVFSKAGAPTAIIMDSENALKKGVELWKLNAHFPLVPMIEDVSHYVGKTLKAEYNSLPIFHSFLNLIENISQKLNMTELFYLRPPKLRTRGRFLGITRFAKWVTRMSDLLSNISRLRTIWIPQNKLENLKDQLHKFRFFSKKFTKVCETMREFLRLLKNQGLNQNSYNQAKILLESLAPQSKIRIQLMDWLDRHIEIQRTLEIGEIPLNVSSDIIESLFGKFKEILRRGPHFEFNRMVLIIPSFCGAWSETAIQENLKSVSHADMRRWINVDLPLSQWDMRRAFNSGKLFSKKVPKTREKKAMAA